jgi:long-chain acyl-CoA synthetase
VPGTLLDCLRQSAARSPHSEAVVQRDRRVTYGLLWQAVGRIGHGLKTAGLDLGERVALLLDNSPEYVAAYYGAMAAGGVVVGLNTASRARELINLLIHSEARFLIGDTGHRELAAVAAHSIPGLRILTLGPSTVDAAESTHY